MQGQGLSPQELTALNLDKSALLEQIIEKEYGGKEDHLLGELQVSPKEVHCCVLKCDT